MKQLLLLFSFFLIACQPVTQTESAAEDDNTPPKHSSKYSDLPYFQQLIDSSQLTGTLVFFDPNNDVYYSNDFDRAEHGFLPASTFKIPNSMIALETGVLDTNTIMQWDGENRRLKQWEKDMDLAEAYRVSCVPCYQWIARNVGVDRMRAYLKKFLHESIFAQS